VAHFGEMHSPRCHSEPVLSARNLLLQGNQQIPRAIRPRFGMKILFGIFKLHHHDALW
jgi:hypothetical protein